MKLYYISTNGPDIIAITETGETEAIEIWEPDFCHDDFFPNAGGNLWDLSEEEQRVACLKELISIAEFSGYDELHDESYVSIVPVTEIMDDTCVVIAEYDEDEENEEIRELKRIVNEHYGF